MNITDEYLDFYKEMLIIQSKFLLEYYNKIFHKLSKSDLISLYKTYFLSVHGNEREYVYFMYNEVTQLVKIGRSNNPLQRLNAINSVFKTQFGMDNKIYLLNVVCVPSGDSSNLEKKLHKKYASLRLNGEWFRLKEKDINDLLQSNMFEKIIDNNYKFYIYDEDFINKIINFELPTDQYLYTFALDILDEYTMKISDNDLEKSIAMKKFIHTNLCHGSPAYFYGLDMRNMRTPFSVSTNNKTWEIFKWLVVNNYMPIPNNNCDDLLILSKSDSSIFSYDDLIRKLLRKDGYYETVTE